MVVGMYYCACISEVAIEVRHCDVQLGMVSRAKINI